MHIRYGYKDRIETAVNIDPTNAHHYAALDTGTDYRTTLTDLPLFWHTLGQIGQIDIAPGIDTEVLNRARDNAFLNMTHAPLGCWGIGFDANPRAPQTWFKNHFRSEAFKA
jgi:hypothetical protein